MLSCPCCSHQVLRHIRGHRLYYFCRHCWIEFSKLDGETDLFAHINSEVKPSNCNTKNSNNGSIFKSVYPLFRSAVSHQFMSSS